MTSRAPHEADATATERRRATMRLCLSVAEKGLLYPLPSRGEVLVGRDLDVAFSIDDKSLSRRHALVRCDESGITVEDLGSKNGIYFHGRLLAPGKRQRLVLGDSVVLGEIVLGVVGRGHAGRLWDAELFEARLSYERQHAQRTGRAFSTVQVRLSASPGPGWLPQALGADRPLTRAGEDAYVALVLAHESAERLVETIRAQVAEHGGSLQHQILTYPQAGDDADKRRRVTSALEACGGNQSRAAQVLGISRPTLIRWVAQLGLPRPREPRAPAPVDDAQTSADREAVEEALLRCGGNQVHAAELLQISRFTLIRRIRRYGLRK